MAKKYLQTAHSYGKKINNMVNITHKRSSLRTAIAQATVKVSHPETIRAIEQDLVPKGNVFEMAKTAGLFAVKRTSDMIPDCHPLPVEFTKVHYEIEGLCIHIQIEVHTIYRTGVEVEAMHGASVIALTMYDMLKPIDKGIEIQNIKLIRKKGGKSDFKNKVTASEPITFIQCSDDTYQHLETDQLTAVMTTILSKNDLHLQPTIYLPENGELIKEHIKAQQDCPLILITGKTEQINHILTPLFDQKIPGIGEVIRQYQNERNPGAFFSDCIGGILNHSLVITLPASSTDLSAALHALFPYVLSIINRLKNNETSI